MNRSIIVAASACLVAAVPAQADFIVEFRSSIQQFYNFFGRVVTDGSGTPVNFSITDANTGFWRIYSDNPAVDSLNTLTFAGGSNRDIFLVIGQPGIDWNPFQDPGGGAMKHWIGGVNEGAYNVHVQASVREQLGPVSAENISRVKAGVALIGTLSSRTGNIVMVEAPLAIENGFGAPGVHAFAGAIQNVSIAGDFIGNVTASNNATIGTINVTGNYIGTTSTTNGSIGNVLVGANWGGTISSGGLITSINIAGVAGVAVQGGSLVLAASSIQTTGGAGLDQLDVGSDFIGDIGISGNLPDVDIQGGLFSVSGQNVIPASVQVSGSITSFLIGNAVNLANNNISAIANFDFGTVDPAGFIRMNGDYTSGTLAMNDGLPTNALVSIGGSLQSVAQVSMNLLSADVNDVGMAGQIVVNANNGASTWSTGTVQVVADSGPVALSEDYTNLSSEFGGGATGLAPFNFHQRETAPSAGETRDCNPYQNEAVTITPLGSLNEVIISHYGSVYADGPGPHFRVEFRPDIAPFPQVPAWTDKTSLFEIDPNQTGQSNLAGQRIAVIKATDSNKEGFKAAGRWRIRPLAGKVKCSDVTGNPDVAYNSSVVSGDLGSSTGMQYDWYAFRVFLEAPGGSTLLSTNNGPQASDLTAWILNPFETNASGTTNIQDFIDMAAQYTGP